MIATFDENTHYFNLGVANILGHIPFANPKIAASYFRLAAYRGHNSSMYVLGDLYRLGWGVVHCEELAAKYYQLALNNGLFSAKAQLKVFLKRKRKESTMDGAPFLHEQDSYTPKKYVELHICLKQLLETSDEQILFNLAASFFNQYGLDLNQNKDLERLKNLNYITVKYALELISEAAEMCHAQAAFIKAALHRWGILNHEKNEKIAFDYFLIAAQNKHPRAAYNIAVYHDRGIGIACKQSTLNWLKFAAELEEPSACYELAMFYKNGFYELLEVDLKKHSFYLEKAAQLGHNKAKELIALTKKKKK